MKFAIKIPTKNLKNYLVALLFAVSLASCNPTKKLLPNQFMVDRVEVKNYRQTNIPKENFEEFFRQKPNRKFFRGIDKLYWKKNGNFIHSVDFYVWWYNSFDNEKIAKKRIARNLKYDQKNAKKSLRFEKKNERRTAKGKKPRTPKLKDKESPMLIESARDIGEPAVIFDSLLMEQTRFQLSRYLFSKGFFNSMVTDTVQVNKKTKRVSVKYILYPQKEYTINKISYNMEDEELGKLILRDTVNSLLKRGMAYDEEKLYAERQRITDKALNNGYYYFENAYVSFDVDSAFSNHSVSVEVRLKKYAQPSGSRNDSLVLVNHPKYSIQNVYIITEPVIGNVRDAHFNDTSYTRRMGTVFLLNNELAFKKRLLLRNIDMYRGQFFRRDTAQQTYKQLSGLGVFRNVTIQFFENNNYGDNRLDCYIVCNPLLKQQLGMEIEGTNTSGNLGIAGNLVHQNRSLFKGGELLEFRMRGALLAQRQLDTKDNNSLNDIDDLRKLQNTFSTIQFGPELKFSVPRAMFPFSLFPFRKDQQPRTYIKTSLNYQASPVFNRVISDIDYGFNFKTMNGRLKHDIIPFEAYLVRARLVPSYEDSITKQNDAFLLNSFQDHITILCKYGVSFTSKENSVSGSRPAYFAKLNIQSAGSGLRELYKLTGQQSDSLGHYLMFNIPFAQFIKVDADLRTYIPFGKKSRWVYRVAGGIAKPLKNLGVIPYEQSFFSGGPNSVRAWRARTLGPGGYDPTGSPVRYDKIGDILLEGNAEFRFHIIKAFNGALFVDAGNVWRLYPDEKKPNGQFLANSFIGQIAIGGGFGVRWDLNFFVLRLDAAVPLKDPKQPEGQRWTFDDKPWEYTVLNFGIGYPF